MRVLNHNLVIGGSIASASRPTEGLDRIAGRASLPMAREAPPQYCRVFDHEGPFDDEEALFVLLTRFEGMHLQIY